MANVTHNTFAYKSRCINSCGYQESFFSSAASVDSRREGFNLHSHMVMIFHPSFFNALTALASLALLVLILFSHHSVLVLGTTKYRQFLCPCQKQPWIKMTVLYLGKTRSGFPGSVASCSLYRKPCACRNFRTSSSGLVSLPLIRLML